MFSSSIITIGSTFNNKGVPGAADGVGSGAAEAGAALDSYKAENLVVF